MSTNAVGSPSVRLVTLRALAAWLLLGLVLWQTGEALTQPLLPLYARVADALMPAFAAKLSLEPIEGTTHISMLATLERPLPMGPRVTVPAGRQVPASITLLHSLVPVVIFGTVVLAWPASSWRRLLARLVLALFAVVLVQCLVTPPHLVGNLERGLQDAIGQLGGTPQVPLVVRWMLFMEGGGRWLVPIVAGASCVLATEPALARRLAGPTAPAVARS